MDLRRRTKKARISRAFLCLRPLLLVSVETDGRFSGPVSAFGIPVHGGPGSVFFPWGIRADASTSPVFVGGRSFRLVNPAVAGPDGRTGGTIWPEPRADWRPDAMGGEAAFNGSFDQSGGDEGHRDRHVHMTRCATDAGNTTSRDLLRPRFAPGDQQEGIGFFVFDPISVRRTMRTQHRNHSRLLGVRKASGFSQNRFKCRPDRMQAYSLRIRCPGPRASSIH